MAAIGFEDQLWASADKLRNNMDASEYKHVIVGLLFKKYVLYTFIGKIRRSMKRDPDLDFAEDIDEYIAECISWKGCWIFF